MSRSFLHGLAILQAVDDDPRSISDLARQLGLDKATVSRLVAAAEADGWVTRHGRLVGIGPRAALLGQGAPASLAVRAAEPLVQAVAGVTGLLTQALGLIGSRVVVLTSAAGRRHEIPTGLGYTSPVWAGAGPKVIAAQLPPDHVEVSEEELASRTLKAIPDRLMRPYLDYFKLSGRSDKNPTTRPASRDELFEQLAAIRRDGCFTEHGELVPGISCHAVMWPQPGLPAALVTLARTREYLNQAAQVHAALEAAASPEATPEDIIAAVAEANQRRP